MPILCDCTLSAPLSRTCWQLQGNDGSDGGGGDDGGGNGGGGKGGGGKGGGEGGGGDGGGEGGGGEGGGEGAQEWPQQFCVKELCAFWHANPAWTLLI